MLRVQGAGKPLPAPEAIREQILDRIHFMPHLRQRLIVPPGRLGPPFLVDDPNFDIDYHLIVISGEQVSDARLHQIVGTSMQRPLARSRPLWELQLIYGLDDGGMALVIKGHHLILDGLMAWQGITAIAGRPRAGGRGDRPGRVGAAAAADQRRGGAPRRRPPGTDRAQARVQPRQRREGSRSCAAASSTRWRACPGPCATRSPRARRGCPSTARSGSGARSRGCRSRCRRSRRRPRRRPST